MDPISKAAINDLRRSSPFVTASEALIAINRMGSLEALQKAVFEETKEELSYGTLNILIDFTCTIFDYLYEADEREDDEPLIITSASFPLLFPDVGVKRNHGINRPKETNIIEFDLKRAICFFVEQNLADLFSQIAQRLKFHCQWSLNNFIN